MQQGPVDPDDFRPRLLGRTALKKWPSGGRGSRRRPAILPPSAANKCTSRAPVRVLQLANVFSARESRRLGPRSHVDRLTGDGGSGAHRPTFQPGGPGASLDSREGASPLLGLVLSLPACAATLAEFDITRRHSCSWARPRPRPACC